MGSEEYILLVKRKLWVMATPKSPWCCFGNVGAKRLQLKGFELFKQSFSWILAITSLHPLD